MLFLVDSNDKLQLTRDSAASIDAHVSWIDVVSGAGAAGKTNTNFASAATGDMVAAPSSGIRAVKHIGIRNKDASLSCTVTVIFDDNGTDFELHKVLLQPGEQLEYHDGIGWFKIAADPVANPVSVLRLSSNFGLSSTTPSEVTGLTKALSAGTYLFDYMIIAQSAATTTGHKFDVNFDGTATTLSFWVEWLTAATTASDDVPDQDHVAAPGGVMSAFSARSGGTTGTGQTTDVDAANSDVLYRIQGLVVVTVAGNLELWFGCEAAAAATVMAGSSLRVTQTA